MKKFLPLVTAKNTKIVAVCALSMALAAIICTLSPKQETITNVKCDKTTKFKSVKDSVLYTRLATYASLQQEYEAAQKKARKTNLFTKYKDRELQINSYEKLKSVYPTVSYYPNMTIRDYEWYINSYLRDSLEARYQYLQRLIKQK